jgi:hypothetical protein
MTARAHVAIRLTALAWIVTMALLPRAGVSSAKLEAKPAVVASTPAGPAHAHVLASTGHVPALARR